MPEQAPQTDVTLKGDPKLIVNVDSSLDVDEAIVSDPQAELKGDPKLIVEPGVDVTGAMAGDEAPVAEAQNPTSSQVRG